MSAALNAVDPEEARNDDREATYPPRFERLPTPLGLPFPLKPAGSADSGVETLPDGRTSFWIRHDVVRGVTPRMLAWWFRNLEGTVRFAGRTYNRYRFWHPGDHVHASYARRRPDGTVGPGAAIRLIEVLGRDPRFLVDTTTVIERLDEGGYVHSPDLHGRRGFVRMEYAFERVPAGTLYENRLVIGSAAAWYPLVRPLVRRFGFTDAQGQAWIRHNVEEVGMFEHFLPGLYRAETGRTE
jgi:DAPG hydrolase-like protein